MNYQLIEKLIIANNQTCPPFTYSNPALDKNVTKALSKCFLDIIKKTRDNSNSNKLRLSVLETIRNLCTSQPLGHLDINENITEVLINIYDKHVQDESKKVDSDIDKNLDAFLIRTSKEVNIIPLSQVPIEPEVIKALLNLNENYFKDVLQKEIIHLDNEDTKTQIILKELWKQDKCESICEDLAIKVRFDIERILLENTLPLLDDKNCDLDDLFTSNNDLSNLIITCSTSSNCFHMCISILNALLVLGHFNPEVLRFIETFINNVKNNCDKVSFSVLYPANLTHVATLLDIDIDDITDKAIQERYINTTLKYLNDVNEESVNNLIMLLSHFPPWFNYYFEQPQHKNL